MKSLKFFTFSLVISFAFIQLVYASAYISKRPDGEGLFEYKVTPGMVLQDTILFKNTSDNDVVLSLEPVGATLAGNLKFPIDAETYDAETWEFSETGSFVPYSSKDSTAKVVSWVELDETEISILPGEMYEVPFRMVVPDDTEEYMTYFGGIQSALKTVGEGKLEGSGTYIKTAKVDRVYVHVLPNAHKDEALLANEGKVVTTPWHLYLGALLLILIAGYPLLKGRKKSKKNKKK